jgi:hypothetical protein
MSIQNKNCIEFTFYHQDKKNDAIFSIYPGLGLLGPTHQIVQVDPPQKNQVGMVTRLPTFPSP